MEAWSGHSEGAKGHAIIVGVTSKAPDSSLDYRPILMAVAVATVGMLPPFLTGGLAVQVRADLDFGPGALGIAVAAALTGLLVQWFGWRAAFAGPGVVCMALGVLFMRVVPPETESPAKRKGGAKVRLSRSAVNRALATALARTL